MLKMSLAIWWVFRVCPHALIKGFLVRIYSHLDNTILFHIPALPCILWISDLLFRVVYRSNKKKMPGTTLITRTAVPQIN